LSTLNRSLEQIGSLKDLIPRIQKPIKPQPHKIMQENHELKLELAIE